MITNDMIKQAMIVNSIITYSIIDTFNLANTTCITTEITLHHTLSGMAHTMVVYQVHGEQLDLHAYIVNALVDDEMVSDYDSMIRLYRRYITNQIREDKLAKIQARTELNRAISDANPIHNPYVRDAQPIVAFDSHKIKKTKCDEDDELIKRTIAFFERWVMEFNQHLEKMKNEKGPE